MPGLAHILLGLTALERWGATRRLESRTEPHQWFVLIGVMVMVVLLVLLIAISVRRHSSKERKVEAFADNAERRGLSPRERQILLAVTMRSGLLQTYEIFHEIDAFNRGTVQLLGECAQTRTPPEMEILKAEIERLRLKLGFQKAKGGGTTGRESANTHRIPVGASVDLAGRRGRQEVTVRAKVLRNEANELSLTLSAPLTSKAGDLWLAHCCVGMSVWEFRTTTVRCDGQSLALTHSEQIRLVNRRRFPRVSVRLPGWIAPFPLTRSATESEKGMPAGTEGSGPVGMPVFVEGTVTELAGPGLRLEAPLQVQVDDRVLVVFRVEGGAGARVRPQTVAVVGCVKHGRDLESGVPIPDVIDRVWEGAEPRDRYARAAQPLCLAIEITGLSDDEIEELVCLTNELSARGSDPSATGMAEAAETSADVVTAT